MSLRRALVASAAVLLLGAAGGGAWLWPKLTWGEVDLPWTDPLPTRAVNAGYSSFYSWRGGPVWKEWEDAGLDAAPPNPAGPLIIDTIHTNKQPWNADMSMTAYSYTHMHGFKRALAPVAAAGIALEPLRGRYSGRALAGAAGVFINLPSGDNEAFTTSEVYALTEFVKRGGGLVLIADHTNCYFHAEMLAPLTKTLGVTLPPVTATDDALRLTPHSVSWIRVESFAEHPITAGVRALGLTTATAVEGLTPLAFTSTAGWWDTWEPYRRDDSSGLTGDLKRQDTERPGPAPVIAAGEVGEGRVVVLGDQNAWGATLIGYEDNARLFTNAMAWALRRELPRPARGVTTIGRACGSVDKEGYRTFQVQLQRWSAQTGTPEGCVAGTPERGTAHVILPQDARDDLDALLDAPTVLAILDPAAGITAPLLAKFGLTASEGAHESALARWVATKAAPDVPVLDYGDDTIAATPMTVTGLEPWMVDDLGRTVVGRVPGRDVVLVLDPTLVSNTTLGGERDDPRTWRWFGPSTPKLAGHRLAHRLAAELFR